eukprot:9486034-Pyramimonas_sp.AAC.1
MPPRHYRGTRVVTLAAPPSLAVVDVLHEHVPPLFGSVGLRVPMERVVRARAHLLRAPRLFPEARVDCPPVGQVHSLLRAGRDPWELQDPLRCARPRRSRCCRLGGRRGRLCRGSRWLLEGRSCWPPQDNRGVGSAPSNSSASSATCPSAIASASALAGAAAAAAGDASGSAAGATGDGVDVTGDPLAVGDAPAGDPRILKLRRGPSFAWPKTWPPNWPEPITICSICIMLFSMLYGGVELERPERGATDA